MQFKTCHVSFFYTSSTDEKWVFFNDFSGLETKRSRMGLNQECKVGVGWFPIEICRTQLVSAKSHELQGLYSTCSKFPSKDLSLFSAYLYPTALGPIELFKLVMNTINVFHTDRSGCPVTAGLIFKLIFSTSEITCPSVGCLWGFVPINLLQSIWALIWLRFYLSLTMNLMLVLAANLNVQALSINFFLHSIFSIVLFQITF